MLALVGEFLRNEDGFWQTIGGLVGGLFGGGTGKLAAGAIGAALGKRRDQKDAAAFDRAIATADYRRMRALGFTHHEIAGMPGGASAGDSQQAIMGNQASTMQAQEKQQAFDAEQRALDRQLAITQTAMQTGAQVEAAGIGAAPMMAQVEALNTLRQAEEALANVKLRTMMNADRRADIDRARYSLARIIHDVSTGAGKGTAEDWANVSAIAAERGAPAAAITGGVLAVRRALGGAAMTGLNRLFGWGYQKAPGFRN